MSETERAESIASLARGDNTSSDFFNVTSMYLVYVDEAGELHYQAWQDLPAQGGLIDPETGDDLELVGWVPEVAEMPRA